ncbi:hypothetical protein, partial [Kitasatospora nipponensis]|uniref:hypothetical protein n=1 Tax=Kitasatospora nipponensis TaxID=258049 RepID=UPI0031DDCE00
TPDAYMFNTVTGASRGTMVLIRNFSVVRSCFAREPRCSRAVVILLGVDYFLIRRLRRLSASSHTLWR